MATLALLVLGKCDAEVQAFTQRSPHACTEARVQLTSNPNRRFGGYAQIANPFIDGATEDVVGVVHADTTFGPTALRTLALAAIEGQVVGIVGRSPTGYIWGNDGGGFVSTLDSCSVFFPRALGLRFDGAAFDDFHRVVEDLCLQAKARGIPAFVPSIKANHAGGVDRPANWLASYRAYRAKLARKWRHISFVTT